MSNRISRLLATMTCAVALNVYASDDASQPRKDDKHHHPSQAALDACKNAAENAACQFTGKNNSSMNGTCVTPRNSEAQATLACHPNHKDRKPKADAGKDQQSN